MLVFYDLSESSVAPLKLCKVAQREGVALPDLRGSLLRCAIFLTAIVFVATSPRTSGADEYLIRPGDSVAVYINGEMSLVTPQIVTAGGLVPVPFVGHLPIDGLTAHEAQESISDALMRSDLYTNADVLVVVTDSQPIYVSGLVENPGAFPIRGVMTVSKAIALAGGVRTLADDRGSPGAVFQYFNAVAALEEDRREVLRASLILQRIEAQLSNATELPAFEVPDAIDLPAKVVDEAKSEEKKRYYLLEFEAKEAREILEKNIELVKDEIGTIIARRAELQTLVEVLDEDVEKARELVRRGLGKSSSVVAAQRTLSLARVDMLEMDRALTIAEQRLAREETSLRGLDTTRALTLADERLQLVDMLAGATARLAARRQQVAMSPGLFSMTATEDAVSLLQYIIERQIDGVPERQSVGESFVMLPGDLLIVSAAQVAN